MSKYRVRVFKGILPKELSLFPKRFSRRWVLFQRDRDLSVRSLAFNPSADNPIIQLFLTSLKKNADKRYVRY